MKKTVKTIIIIVMILLLTGSIYYVASNINVLKDKFDDFTITTTTTKKTTTTTTSTTTTTKYVEIDVDSMLKDVKREKGKVNIYFFYGKGCPHCEHEHEALAEIKKEYGDFYNLYEFEIWYNEANRSLAHIFAEKLNIELKGVPFTEIGEQYMSGFGDESKQVLIQNIESEKDKGYDIYFDEIKE